MLVFNQRIDEYIHCFIQRKAADPNRFSNRGGALLKESKDRAKVQKLLPKVQNKHHCIYISLPTVSCVFFNVARLSQSFRRTGESLDSIAAF